MKNDGIQRIKNHNWQGFHLFFNYQNIPIEFTEKENLLHWKQLFCAEKCSNFHDFFFSTTQRWLERIEWFVLWNKSIQKCLILNLKKNLCVSIELKFGSFLPNRFWFRDLQGLKIKLKWHSTSTPIWLTVHHMMLSKQLHQVRLQ